MRLINISNNGRVIYTFCRNAMGVREIKEIKDFYPYYYESDNEGSYTAFTGESLRKIIVSDPRSIVENRSAQSWESDINICKRYVIDKVKTIEPCPIHYAFIDIETLSKDFPNVYKAKDRVSCISVWDSFTKKTTTFYLGDYGETNEKQMLQDFIEHLKTNEYDIWTSWNIDFDYTYLFNRMVRLGTKTPFSDIISPIGQHRYSGKDVSYPAGIAIVDYLTLYKLIFKGLNSYSLDNVLTHEFGIGKIHSKVDFSVLNDTVKQRNIGDVEGMVKIDAKHGIIDHYNEIRMLTKVSWEDFVYNSRAIDMLLLAEARSKGVVLPRKPKKVEGVVKKKFEQAYREIFEKGRFENVGKYDLSGAYLNAIIDLNIDAANITEKDNYTVPVNITDRKTQKVIETYFIKQNSNTLLPSIAKLLLTEKNKLKELKKNTNPESAEYESIEKRYAAMKDVVLSSWGAIGNEYFRLFDIRIASMITSTVRDIVHYVRDELEKRNYSILYLDTDGIICRDNGKNITPLLNEIIQQWSQKRFGKKSSIEFEYEGHFKVLILLAMCRYKGWLKREDGKIKTEIKGIESKRKDSTIYLKSFQTELLERIKNNESMAKIVEWIQKEIKDLPNKPLIDVAFPCRLGRKPEDYVSVPIFVRALNNTPNFKQVRVGQSFYYIFVNSNDYEINMVEKKVIMTYDKNGNEKGFKNITDKRLEMAMEMNDAQGLDLENKGLIKKEKVEVKGKCKDVMAFDEEHLEIIDRNNVNWTRIIERNILNKVEVIFEAMGWKEEFDKVILNNESTKFAEEVSRETHLDTIKESEMQVLDSAPASMVFKGSTSGFQLESDGSSPSVRSNFDKIQEEKAKTQIINDFDLKDLEMRRLTFQEVKPYIVENHYAHTIASSMRLALGFYYNNKLVTAVVYGYPVGRRVVQWLKVEKENCAELVRLFSQDELPKNTESYCIGQSFKYIKENMPELKYLISYADPNHGHVGYIYQATNWRYIGVQRRLLPERRIFIDGQEVHTRTLNAKHGSTSKKNLEKIYGDRLKIKPALKKHVYLICLGNKRERREWYKKFPKEKYPKIKEDKQ